MLFAEGSCLFCNGWCAITHSLIGAGNEQEGIVNMCHHPQFDIDETCMIYGMALTVSLGLMGI